jgi:DNA-binding NtrC family response regulator
MQERSASHFFEVLVAYSDTEQSQILATILGHCGLAPVLCSSLKEARTLLGRESIRLVFCEQRLTDGTFRDLLQPASRLSLPLVVFSRRDDSKLHAEAIRSGASDCIGPPFHHRQIEGVVQNALLAAPARTRDARAHSNPPLT